MDASSTERLIGATAYAPALGMGTTTDGYGYFSLTVPADSVTLQYSYTGYVLAKALYNATPTSPVTVRLTAGTQLTTAEVIASRARAPINERVGVSTVEIPMVQYKTAPVLLGEPDILKTLQLMPGVQGGAEGTAGLYVRGGSPDQNLILLDGVPVYNISHALGVFSVFNADAIQSVKLTKGGFPARFGGRLSSVLEVEMKDGPADRWRVEGAVGLTAARATVGGPVGERTRILVSARRTYFDAVYGPINLIQNAGTDYRNILRANFFDTYLKLRHDASPRHRLYLSGYLGGDRFVTGHEEDNPQWGYSYYEEGVRWGNQVSALRWRWQLGPRAFLNTTASRSRYAITNAFASRFRDRVDTLINSQASDYASAVRDINLKTDFVLALDPRSTFRAGALATHHRYQPGQLRERRRGAEIQLDTVLRDRQIDATEAAAYLEHEWALSRRLAVDYGLHASAFVSDQTYASLQPRLSARYRLPADMALKASYATMAQYVNLVTTESLSLPSDIWVPSTARVSPQRSWQATLALAKQLPASIELSAEAFYKALDGVVSYRAGESFFEFDPQRSWEDKVTQGTGAVYGLELLAQKTAGSTTGWVGYTYSRNDRTFADLNGGRTFPFRYDRRHDFSVLLTHRLSARVTLSGTFVFFTGNAYTLPEYQQYTNLELAPAIGRFDRDEIHLSPAPQASSRNQFRVSNSHRLDLSVTLTKPKRWGERSWVFGVYNAYWHKNPVYVQAKDVVVRDPTTSAVVSVERQFREVALVPIVPSVAYQFRFGL